MRGMVARSRKTTVGKEVVGSDMLTPGLIIRYPQ